MVKTSYPMSKVRGSGPGGLPTSEVGAAAEGGYPTSEVGVAAEGGYPTSEVRAAAETGYPTSEVRGNGGEEQPQVQGVVAAQAQEGLEVLYHVEGQEGRR